MEAKTAPVQEQERSGRRLSDEFIAKNIELVQTYSMPLVLVLLAVFFAITARYFFTVSNALTITNHAAVGGTLALGMTFVLIVGGIDLSVGSVVTLTTVVLGLCLVDFGLDTWLALPLGLMTGCVIGLANGLLVVKTNVPPVIVTLGMMYMMQSVASFITRGAITSLAEFSVVTFLGQGYVGAIPVPALILLSLTIICYILLTRTTFGAYVRAIGGNRDASVVMGLEVARYQIAVYVLSGLMASIAGVMVAGRLSMSSAQTGLGLELPAIAAAVLGGTSLVGGEGTVFGTLIGALIISVVFNGLILLGLPFFYQLVATGCVLVLAVAFNEAIRRLT